ncbi:DUF2000 domain-containing protein [Bacillus sp. 03113]|uniref:DUF2000 domain-containing protein n=1 Tax=Bacillus sp. 03113 TaxID=2578211 RepID=UPI001141A2DE|nr:DUF2000 domain-containing protein [Bacillus sp. 03113]
MQTNVKKKKCVLVIDSELPLGLIANTAMILGYSLGNYTDDFMGSDILDGSGQWHLGITTTPIPVLKGSKEKIKELRDKTTCEDFTDLMVVDFSNIAQQCLTYDEYIKEASKRFKDDFEYLGIAIYGESKKVNKLTGSMPLLR